MDKQLDNVFHIDLSDSEFSLSTDNLVITGSAGEDVITTFDSNGTHWQSNSTMNGTINVTNPVYTISTVNANTNYTLDSYNSINITGLDGVEWVDTLPDIDKVKEMCNEYPGLEKAFENFRTVYKMVEQDWLGKQKKC
jgi:anionic cell wall polymer biosynthesis LytR-Cps2A-Psr (LCP) family protein